MFDVKEIIFLCIFVAAIMTPIVISILKRDK